MAGLVFDIGLPSGWYIAGAGGSELTITSPKDAQSGQHAEFYLRVTEPPSGPDGSDEPSMDPAVLRSALLDMYTPYKEPKIFRSSKQTVGGIEMIRQELNQTTIKNAAGKSVASTGCKTYPSSS